MYYVDENTLILLLIIQRNLYRFSLNLVSR